jgi:hypothetical protein
LPRQAHILFHANFPDERKISNLTITASSETPVLVDAAVEVNLKRARLLPLDPINIDIDSVRKVLDNY